VETRYYHVGIVVEDLDAAMEELTRLVGVDWGEPHESHYGDWNIRVVYSREQPFLELIEGEPGGPWDTADGPRLDHIGYFTDDVLADVAELQAKGATMSFDPGPYGRGEVFAYLRTPGTKLRVEVVSPEARRIILGEAG
jgi:Glyoxalase/Bleomycin resistance protein/Dioxygenase superfamily